ncbi:tRNA(adenine34) deaminase [Allocatelliglobosispora scoriae]|uniref:tRNA(Adenine34) deaminase n=1 Tax=Allocatelliglobosispora scoriae TaxID=643052 RepID=A0A841BCM3_9ACTN|nr:deaminase [Allocatelliglobosispora scoriae]MBB5866857.1 tRNA(adenine34) deaminase [Allocatelliglobosispora scoriae]
MTPEEMIGAALAVAEAGLAAGEQPIGAVVVLGDEVVAQAYTQEKASGRRLVHADLLAMTAADHLLGWRRMPHPLRLAVNLEPCVMCLGAAMALGVGEVYFALESPADGAARVAAEWPSHPDAPWFTAPAVIGGIRREESRELFRRYCDSVPDSPMRRWAQTLVNLPQ